MDLSNPDGRGKMKITRMTINENSTSFDFEGRLTDTDHLSSLMNIFIMHKTEVRQTHRRSENLFRGWHTDKHTSYGNL